MASSIKTTLVNAQSAFLALGIFDEVNRVEPKSPPGNGLSASIYMSSVTPAAEASGLDSASGLYIITARLYSNMLQEPQEEIDSALASAVDLIFDALAGDFDLGATVRNVDFFGAHGTPLMAKWGHVDVGGKMFRAVDITVPLIINDTISDMTV